MGDENSVSEEAPAIELDYGIGRVYVKGDSNTTFQDVVDEFNEQKEEMIDTIEELKRLEFELQDEYAADRGPSSTFE